MRRLGAFTSERSEVTVDCEARHANPTPSAICGECITTILKASRNHLTSSEGTPYAGYYIEYFLPR